MRVLRPLSSGLIVHEDFSAPFIHEPLIADANYVLGTNYVDINSGGIFINAGLYDKVVFEILNAFVPNNLVDIGGISIARGDEKREFFEYYEELSSEVLVPYVKMVKNEDVYTGYHSNDGINWTDKGYTILNGADTLGVDTDSTTPYRLNEIKLYKSEYVSIIQVIPGWSIKVYDDTDTLVIDESITDATKNIKLPKYPFSGVFELYDATNTKITSSELQDVWGGDEYLNTINVTLHNSDGTPLQYDSERHMGAMNDGIIEDYFIVRNNNDIETESTISIADYSPFYSWVFLAYDVNGIPGTLGKELTYTLQPLEEKEFWVVVKRTPETVDSAFDYRSTEALFYLEVS